MLLHIIIGAFALAAFWAIYQKANTAMISLSIWKWILIVVEIIYSTFVIEVIVGFLLEGRPKAAVVMGFFTGILAVIGALLIGRHLLKPSKIAKI